MTIRNILTVIVAMATVSVTTAQAPFKKIKEFATEPVAKVSIDRLGDLYLILENGNIKKYDTEGNFMSVYTSTDKSLPTQFEPWNPLRVFVYSTDRQAVLFLDRFLEPLDNLPIDPVWAVEPAMACPGTNNMLWVLDKADWSLKQIDTKTKAVVQETMLKVGQQKHEFIYMREYQNLLFLIDMRYGVMVFNTLGKLVQQVAVPSVDYIGFIGEEFYYLENHQLKFVDLYTQEVRQIAVDPLARFVLVTDERMMVVKDKFVEISEFKL